ncbi:MAG: hypothetical protein M3O46_10475, partial [Myxococcota bacterium]|nr:hypothetical protein [Myxococcota bacterium]
MGTASERFLRARDGTRDEGPTYPACGDEGDFEPMYLGWEIARCATGLTRDESRAVAALVAACIVAVRAGSTRLPIDEARLGTALTPLGAADSVPLLRSILARARAGQPADPVSAVFGAPDERKPLVLDGEWLYPERMRALEVRFCARVRDRLARAAPTRDPRLLA